MASDSVRLVRIEDRLFEMGADDEAIDRFHDFWDQADTTERTRLYSLGDTRLIAELAVQRELDGNREPTDTLEEQAARISERSIREVRAWVGDDAARARAALEVERARPTPRSSLVIVLSRLADF